MLRSQCVGRCHGGGHSQRLKLAGCFGKHATGGHNLSQWGARWNVLAEQAMMHVNM